MSGKSKSANEHNQIVAAAAQRALMPLGFWRKGRSRLWLADRDFWLAIVEFQPSGFSKGSYLNVAAHWLWSAVPSSLSLDYLLERQKPWIAFQNPAQFAPLAEALAEQAVAEVKQLQDKIGNISTAAALLIEKESAAAKEGRGGGWPAFHAAMAAGLSGDMVTARSLFKAAWDSIGGWRDDLQIQLVPFRDALKKKSTFAEFISHRINEQRSIHGLSPVKFQL